MICSRMIKFRQEEGSAISWGHRNLPPTGKFYEPRERGRERHETQGRRLFKCPVRSILGDLHMLTLEARP